MKGLQLHSLSWELYKVKRGAGENPAKTITAVKEKFGCWQRYLLEEFEGKFSFPADSHKLPLRAFEGFSFDDLCKIHYSSGIMMDRSVTDLFETKAQFEIVRKIESSMWRWGLSKGNWNEVVEAYNCIRHFSFGHPDFELRLDYTTYFNQYGPGKYSRIYLDGVFAYLVYHKRKHVMTIGFSVQDKKRLLIQQVQTAARTGNRWLYQLPLNRLEFIIDLFKKNFPSYHLWVIDGGSLVEKTLADYQQGLRKAEKIGKAEDILIFRSKIEHLKTDGPRLVAFYGNVGRFALGPYKTIRGLIHHQISELGNRN